MDPANPLARREQPASLRLYIARSTPNSIRAQHNLATVLDDLADRMTALKVETIDVFAEPKRAMIDGVVVTPTLIGIAAAKRLVLMGDLADHDHLHRTLEDFLTFNDR